MLVALKVRTAAFWTKYPKGVEKRKMVFYQIFQQELNDKDLPCSWL
jgi:hypothetical protein